MANGLAIYITDLTGFSSDYNDIFTSGSWYIYTDTTINDLALWQSRTNQDQHSFSVDPHFLSLTELRTRHPLLNGSAKVFAEVTQDIEGNLRDSTNPDIGAYEYSDAIFDLGQDTTICNSEPLLIDAGVGYDSYSWNTGATTHSITVDTTSSDPVYYKVTVTYYSISYTDSLKVTFNSPVLNLNEEEGLCTGGSVNLDAGTGYASYLWSDGNTTQTLTVTVAGDYYVKVTDSDGCSATDTVAVIESTGPAVDLGPDKELCNGDSLILDGGNGTYTYLWSSGGTDRYLTVYDSGAYRVTVADTYGCENSDSVHVSLLQAPQVDLGDDTGFCEGSSVTLDAGPGYSSYHWADNSTQQTLTVSVEGTYYVTVTNSLGCAGSDTIYVESYPLPSITISQVDGDLVADNKDGLEYHWYLDQQEISNASDTYSPAESGEYYLMIMDNHQCMNSSNTIQYVHTAFEGDYLSKGIRLYPNPAGNRLFISLTGYHGELKITLINMDGKIVFTENVNQLISSGTGEIDVSGLKNGMYVIKIQNKDIIRTKSLLINR
jgi:hypothetical protein